MPLLLPVQSRTCRCLLDFVQVLCVHDSLAAMGAMHCPWMLESMSCNCALQDVTVSLFFSRTATIHLHCVLPGAMQLPSSASSMPEFKNNVTQSVCMSAGVFSSKLSAIIIQSVCLSAGVFSWKLRRPARSTSCRLCSPSLKSKAQLWPSARRLKGS